MDEDFLGKVASKIYLYSYPYKDGISQYKLLKYFVNTTKTSFNRVLEKENLVERSYIDHWLIPDVGTKIHEKWMVRARPDPLIDHIGNTYDLNKLDRHILIKILDSDIFRKLIGQQLKKAKKPIHDPMFYILSTFDMLLITNEKMINIYKKLKKQGFKVKLYFKNEADYDKYLDDYFPILKEVVPLFLKGKKMKKDQKDFILEAENIMMIMIPPNTYNKIKDGVTFLGNLLNKFNDIHRRINKMPKEFEQLMKDKAPQIIHHLTSKR